MAAEILPFARPKPPEPEEPPIQHGSGEAFCLSCKHVWHAIAPTGCEAFECPACSRVCGHWKFEFAPVGEEVRICCCGNHLFYLTRVGHMCASCGTYQAY